MIILYVLLVAYILAINFYAFLLVKSLRDKEKQANDLKQAAPLIEQANAEDELSAKPVAASTKSTAPPEKFIGKLCITGVLGGAIAIYVCMFIFKFRRSDLLLMVLMPLLGVLNVYLWILLFRSGFRFFIVG